MSTNPTDTATLTGAAAQDALRDRIANYQGNKYPDRRAHAKRAHRTEITFKGVDLLVEYFTEGSYMAATETDPEEFPNCLIQAVEVAGVDITALVDVDDIAERIEQGWRE